MPSVLLSGCHPRRGRDNRRDGRMPFRTGGRSGRGNCPNNDVAPQEIFRNRVRRAHPKPFRLRRGIAARGLHGNTARRLRDGRRQPADNTLYRSSGRHGYGKAVRRKNAAGAITNRYPWRYLYTVVERLAEGLEATIPEVAELGTEIYLTVQN